MPLNIDSYNTTAGSMVDTRRIATAVKEAVVTDDLDKKPESNLGVQSFGAYHPLFITGSHPSESEIPLFAHPISILNIRGKNFICSDLRPFIRKDGSKPIKDRVSDTINFDYAVSRTILNLLWAGGREGDFVTSFAFAARCFGGWVSQVLRGLGFNDLEGVNGRIVGMAYYYMLCHQSFQMDGEGKQSLTDWIFANTQIDEATIREVVDKLKPMMDFSHLIDNLKAGVGGARTEKISVTTMSLSFRSTWYGHEAQKVVAVAMEHPPTWTALVYHVLRYKSIKNCLLAQVADKTGRRNDHEAFLANYNDICKQHLRLENASGIKDAHDPGYCGETLAMECAGKIQAL